jgi:hypothetical protein
LEIVPDAVPFCSVEDAAYSDIFVTGGETLARRGRSLRLLSPRILLTEEWVAELQQAPKS